MSLNTYQFKKIIKEKIKQAAFIYLLELKDKHSKIKDIKYETLEIQRYMIRPNLPILRLT